MFGYGISPADSHIAAVDTLLAADLAGLAIPRPWLAIRARYAEALEADDRAAIYGYASAVAGSGKSADLDRMRADAITAALASSTAVAEVNNAVRAAVLPALISAYSPAAKPNWDTARLAYNRAGVQLQEAIDTVDPDSDPEAIVAAGAEIREAWSATTLLVATLDHLVPILESAAWLAGAPAIDNDVRLNLLLNTEKAHRRRVHENAGAGRAGRWGGWLAAGASIEAPEDPTTITGYEKPGPVVESWVREPGTVGSRRVLTDPADVEYESLMATA